MNYNDNLDKILEYAFEENKSVEIPESQIDSEWEKMNLIRKKRTESTLPKRMLSLVASILIIFGVFSFTNTNDSYSWKIFKNKTVNKNNDGIKVNIGSSTIDNPGTEPSVGIITIDESEIDDYINFNYRNLPYKVNHISVFENTMLTIKYTTDRGSLKFIQELEGDETQLSMNSSPNTTIEEFNLNNIDYTVLNIENSKSKIIWSSFGVMHKIYTNYPISKDESIKIISELY